MNTVRFSCIRVCYVPAGLVATAIFFLPQLLVAQAPKRILETIQPPIGDHSTNWASDVCGGSDTFHPGGARYEWTPVIAGYGQYGSVEGVSGWALNPHDSEADVPFTHPFGKVDFDYLLLPDEPFNGLLAPRNGEFPDNDEDRVLAKAEVDAWKLPLGPGLLAVEQDVDLIPEAYRPRKGMGDRVAVFGRWIIDCGHDNWLSEIHPPLLTVVGRPDSSHQLTRVDIIANPYLVDQEFSNGGVLDQLAHDLALVNTPMPLVVGTFQVMAQANLLPPTKGMEVFSFQIRPPAPAPSDADRLYIRSHLTARSGVVVQPFCVDEETVGVVGLFTDQLRVHPVAGWHNWDVSGEELKGLHEQAGLAYEALVAHIGINLVDPVKAAVLARGIRSILYDAPVPPDDQNATPVTEGWISRNPWGQNPVTVNDNQAFPLVGWIEVQWRRPTETIANVTTTGASKAIERHLNEMRTRPGGRDEMVRAREAGALLTEVVPSSVDSVSGEWHYEIKGARGRDSEEGQLWLRTNGTEIQGEMETASRRRVALRGKLTDGGQVLEVVRLTRGQPGGDQRIRLVRKDVGYGGFIEGPPRQAVELTRPKPK